MQSIKQRPEALETMPEKGISLRTINTCLIVFAVLAAGIMIVSTHRLTTAFRNVTDATEEHMQLESAAHELMDASDYLTEQVQRFTLDGDMRFLESYFNEAFQTDRREDAIARMTSDKNAGAALAELQQAMDGSLALMNREYYAMRLVIEAKGYTQYPELLDTIALTEDDKALSSDEKMALAARMVMDDEYYAQKNQIRANMQESLASLEDLTRSFEDDSLKHLENELFVIRVVIVVETAFILSMIWLTSRLGINPVLRAVDRIKEDSPIPEVGANEFRYLAQAYNKMYSVYKASLEHLNFKASHDELTGAYNRAGYNLLLSGIDLKSTCMMLFDVDNFKSINDTYGHETGDQVLIKLVNVLKANFRSDDYICRVGGDEFVIFMVHSNELQYNLIASTIDHINEDLNHTEDGLPPISISVGIVHGNQVEDASSLFEKTDAALYASKKRGKRTYTFYTDEVK